MIVFLFKQISMICLRCLFKPANILKSLRNFYLQILCISRLCLQIFPLVNVRIGTNSRTFLKKSAFQNQFCPNKVLIIFYMITNETIHTTNETFQFH